MKSFIIYTRVSSRGQFESGLGLESQLEAVRRYIASQNGTTLAVYTECESGRKTDKERPQLKAALDLCKKTKATLCVSKLDRLTRNVQFLYALRDSNVNFICTDSPDIDAFSISILCLVAQKEREMIAARTKAALAALKARGVKLGNPNHIQSVKILNAAATSAAVEFRKEIVPVIQEIKKTGVKTFKALAQCLNARGIQTRQGKTWSTSSVRNVLVNGV